VSPLECRARNLAEQNVSQNNETRGDKKGANDSSGEVP